MANVKIKNDSRKISFGKRKGLSATKTFNKHKAIRTKKSNRGQGK